MNIFGNVKLKGIDENGQEKEFSLSELGEKAVVYFYPKDNTPVCTKEAINFRDKMKELHDKATVIGISADDIESHKQFRQSNFINFPLLSDPDNKLAKMLGILKKNPESGSPAIQRSTFVIKNGLIAKAWRDVDVEGHADEVINSL